MNILSLLILIVLVSLVIGCFQNKRLTPEESTNCRTASVNESLVLLLKKRTNNSIEQIPEINEYGEVLTSNGNGICSLTTDEQDGYDFVIQNKEYFRQNGHLLFVFESRDRKLKIGTFQGTHEIDILKWRHTNGINYNIENSDIVNKIKSWNKLGDFIIYGIGHDWIGLKLKEKINDPKNFANEVYDFCPDIVDQSKGEISELIQQISTYDGVLLWWD